MIKVNLIVLSNKFFFFSKPRQAYPHQRLMGKNRLHYVPISMTTIRNDVTSLQKQLWNKESGKGTNGMGGAGMPNTPNTNYHKCPYVFPINHAVATMLWQTKQPCDSPTPPRLGCRTLTIVRFRVQTLIFTTSALQMRKNGIICAKHSAIYAKSCLADFFIPLQALWRTYCLSC